MHAWLTLLLDSAMFLVTFCYSSHYLLPDFYQLRHVATILFNISRIP